MEGIFETHARELRDPSRGIMRPTEEKHSPQCERVFCPCGGIKRPLAGNHAILYSTRETFAPGRTGTMMLSNAPECLRLAITRLMVERLTWSSRASSIQSGVTMRVAGSIRRSSAAKTCSSRSNGSVCGRPLGMPVALCGFLIFQTFLDFTNSTAIQLSVEYSL